MRVNSDKVWSGRNALKGLVNRISQIVREDRASRFKLGITGNPEGRAQNYVSDDEEYDEMVVVFQTSSKADIRALEESLVDYYWEESDNETGGGGGNVQGPPFFLYVVRDLA